MNELWQLGHAVFELLLTVQQQGVLRTPVATPGHNTDKNDADKDE